MLRGKVVLIEKGINWTSKRRPEARVVVRVTYIIIANVSLKGTDCVHTSHLLQRPGWRLLPTLYIGSYRGLPGGQDTGHSSLAF